MAKRMVFMVNAEAEQILRDLKRQLGTLDESEVLRYTLALAKTILPYADADRTIVILTPDQEVEVDLKV